MMVNDRMPEYTVERAGKILNRHKKALNGSKVLVLGVAYKQDIDDYRESPAIRVIEEFHKTGAETEYYDPFVPKYRHEGQWFQGLEALTPEVVKAHDLVIVTKEGGDLAGWDISLEDIAAGKYTLAVGDENVPAGNYACQSLTTVGGYIEPDGATGADATGKGGEFSATLQPKVTLGGKVGDVCKYAESGEVDIAMVYTSDVYRMGGVAICSVVPNDTHKAITYPGAVCADSKNAEAAQAFLEWCMTDEDANQIWEKWGFELAQN